MIDVRMSIAKFHRILRQHNIALRHYAELEELVYVGKRPGKVVLYRLRHDSNYVACLNAILKELSKGLKHKFPPPDYKAPCSYESLRCEAS